jgi:hypothetical protein
MIECTCTAPDARADEAITKAMDVHVQAERADDEGGGDGAGGALVPAG